MKNAPEIPTMFGTAPFPTLTMNYLAQSVNSTEVGNPYSRVSDIKLFITFVKCLILHTALWTNKTKIISKITIDEG